MQRQTQYTLTYKVICWQMLPGIVGWPHGPYTCSSVWAAMCVLHNQRHRSQEKIEHGCFDVKDKPSYNLWEKPSCNFNCETSHRVWNANRGSKNTQKEPVSAYLIHVENPVSDHRSAAERRPAPADTSRSAPMSGDRKQYQWLDWKTTDVLN